MTLETLFLSIAVIESGYFGKGKRGRAKAQRFAASGLLSYWCGSASASYLLKPRTVVEVR